MEQAAPRRRGRWWLLALPTLSVVVWGQSLVNHPWLLLGGAGAIALPATAVAFSTRRRRWRGTPKPDNDNDNDNDNDKRGHD